MALTIFTWLLALSALVTFSLALFALQRRSVTGALPFAFALFGEFLWSAGYWLELRAPRLADKLIWDNLQFTGADVGVAGAFIFACVYTGRDTWARRYGPMLAVVPVLTALLVWTNSAHDLVRSAPQIVYAGTQSFLIYTYEPWFWVFAGYNLALTLLTISLLVAFAVQSRSYRQPILAFVLGFSAPVVGSLLTLCGLIPIIGLEHLDISAITFAFTIPLMTWVLFRKGLLAIVPIARTLLVEQMRDAVLVIDVQGRVVDANLRAIQLLRRPVDLIVGTPVSALIPKLDRLMASVGEGGLAELALDQPSTVQLEAAISALRGRRANHLGWLVVLRDNTESKRQSHYQRTLAGCSQALLRSGYQGAATDHVLGEVLELLRVAAQVSRIDLCRSAVDPQGNLQALIIAQAHAPELAPLFLPGHLPQALLTRLRDLLQHGQEIYGPVARLFGDWPDVLPPLAEAGVRSLLLVPVSGVQGWQGMLSASSGRPDQQWDAPTREFLRAACDMIAVSTRQWEAARALQEREHFIQRVAHATPDIIYVYDLRDQRLVYANRATVPSGHAAEQLVGLGERELALLTPTEREQRQAYAEKIAAAADQAICSLEYRLQATDGRSVWLLRRDTIFARDEAGSPTQILGVIQDITEGQRRAEALLQAKDEAEAANRAKTAFLSMMSHELRTPLTAVIGYSQLLEQMVQAGEYHTVATDLHQIYASGMQLLELINDVLDVSSIEAGGLQVDPAPIDIPELVRGAAMVVGPLVERNRNTLRIDCPAALPLMYSDGSRVRQVLLHLLNNAAKFTEAGTIILTVEQVQVDGAPWIVFQVTDTGIGIDASQMHKLFRPFSQVDESQSRKYGGTGLGLLLSQRLCQLLGGELTVMSRLGEGSVFAARLPMTILGGPTSARDLLSGEDRP